MRRYEVANLLEEQTAEGRNTKTSKSKLKLENKHAEVVEW